MTSPIPGAPIGPEIPTGSRHIVYDHVPRLHELLANGGWPGVVYAQACIHNVKHAADRTDRPAHLRPIRGATYYSIEGPRGRADMALVGAGSPIPGAAPEAGARLFFTDGEVERITGLAVEWPIWFRNLPEETWDGAQQVEVSQGADRDARVQARQAPQRKQEGPRGEEQEASHRDRAVGIPKKRKNLKGHTHPPNFGRLMDDCPRCAKLAEERVTS